jgi:CelD/BcsL family acetyltransferase involved in cellulose biosynthesis
MRVDVITRIEDIAAIRERWEDLALADPRDGFFRTPAWYLAWMKHIRPDAEPFVVVVRDRTGGVVGIAPLCRLTFRDLGFRLAALSFAGREVVSGDFLDFVAENPIRDQVVMEFTRFFWEHRDEWGLFVAGELVEGGGSHRALQSLADEHDLTVRSQEDRVCPYIELPASFDAYLSALSSSTRYHIRRRMRDVLEKGGCRVEAYAEPDTICEHLDTLIRLHVARWQREDMPGTLTRPGFPEFLRQICGNPTRTSKSKLYILWLDGKPAAGLLMFYFGDSALYYQAGWDPSSAVAALSPGVVVMARSIQDAIAEGAKYYEFLRGDESYKSRWTNTQRTTTTLLCARGFMAKEYLRVCQLKDAVKHRITAASDMRRRIGSQRATDEVVTG